jgi:HK97 family phage prohead protease
MLQGFADGEIILEERARRGGRRLSGRFPYNSTAVLSDGGRTGRPRKERFAPRAFAYNVEREDVDVRLLVGHDFGKPLARRGAGTLDLQDGDEALTFTATIPIDMEEVTYVRDFLAGHSAGLVRGISPGFRVPPRRTVPNAERVDEEDPAEGRALIRTIMQALLFELSVVTSAAYPDAEVEARNWTPESVATSRPNVTKEVLRGWLL